MGSHMSCEDVNSVHSYQPASGNRGGRSDRSGPSTYSSRHLSTSPPRPSGSSSSTSQGASLPVDVRQMSSEMRSLNMYDAGALAQYQHFQNIIQRRRQTICTSTASHSLPNDNRSISAGEAPDVIMASSSLGQHPLTLTPQQMRLLVQGRIVCGLCHEEFSVEEFEEHVISCLTQPHVQYNADILTDDKGECLICFEDMKIGQMIARLPCLCIYHRTCLDRWFRQKQVCPVHPDTV